MKHTVDSLVKNADDLPSLPTIYQDITRAVKNPKSSVQDVAAIITKDQALTARLLKVVNSSFYGFAEKIDTVSDALSMIGMREVLDLALGTCVIGVFKDLPENLVSPPSFWQHSIGVAIASSVVAVECGDSNPERFFTGGLLHDIGRLIMYIKLPAESALVLESTTSTERLDIHIEEEQLGFNHADLGGALMQRWNLSPSIIEMVRSHHRPNLAKVAQTETCVVHIADFIISGLSLGSSGEYMVPALHPDAWDRTHVDVDKLPRIIQDIESQTKDMTDVFLATV